MELGLDDPSRRPDRRFILGAGISLAAAAAIWRVVGDHKPTISMPLIEYVCDQVLPATDTPGALQVGVPGFLVQAVEIGMAGTLGDELIRLEQELHRLANISFMKLSADQRLSKLTAHDAAVFARVDPAASSVWPVVKRLIIAGYYTSEVGGSQEQQYELDLGHFDADVPYKKGDRAYSNDWFGVS